MALLTVTLATTPTTPGGQFVVTGDTFTEVKGKLQTELTNRLNAANNQAAAVQNVINALNT